MMEIFTITYDSEGLIWYLIFKVLKLHARLGKPIPSSNPVVLTTKTTSTEAVSSKESSKETKTTTTVTTKKVVAPKINFVGGMYNE